MVTSLMTSDRPAARIGNQSTSLPIATMSCSMRCKVDPIVNSRIGAPTDPLTMFIPDAPVEKSPEIGLTPLCRPETSWMSTPSSMPAISSACDFEPVSYTHLTLPTKA